jgi:outer membrane lipopolysaccharide assembly protein LptE/RlpB
MRCLFCFVLTFSLLGCGYHFPGQAGNVPGQVNSVYISLFTNQTSEPQLENRMTNQVSQVFSRRKSLVQVERIDLAEAILQGTIQSYRSRPLAYDAQDNISEYRASMKVRAELLGGVEQQNVLWQATETWAVDYLADDDKTKQEDLEDQAIDELSLRLAEALFYKLLDDF